MFNAKLRRLFAVWMDPNEAYPFVYFLVYSFLQKRIEKRD